MIIDKSHSKKDLLEIVERFNFHIINPETLSKYDLCRNIIIVLKTIIDIKPDTELLMITDKGQLIDYLQKPSPIKILTIKEKNNIMDKAKSIIKYCIEGFNIENSIYQLKSDVYYNCVEVSKYGDIPSCRRAVNLFNNSRTFPPIKIEMSNRCKLELKKKDKLRKQSNNCLTIKRGKFIITFD